MKRAALWQVAGSAAMHCDTVHSWACVCVQNQSMCKSDSRSRRTWLKRPRAAGSVCGGIEGKSGTCRNISFKKDNLHLCASSLSSESPHLSASSGVGLQMKAERFFNKPISARFLIV